MSNLARLTNAANRIAAWEDWRKLAAAARAANVDPAPYAPKHNAGRRAIDRCIAALRDALARAGETEPAEQEVWKTRMGGRE